MISGPRPGPPPRAPRPPPPPRLRRRPSSRRSPSAIGANTAIFTVVRAVLLRPLPFARRRPPRHGLLGRAREATGSPSRSPTSWTCGRARGASSFLVAWGGWSANLTGVDEPVALKAQWTSSGFFASLGVRAALGRTPSAGGGAARRGRAWPCSATGSGARASAPTGGVLGPRPDPERRAVHRDRSPSADVPLLRGERGARLAALARDGPAPRTPRLRIPAGAGASATRSGIAAATAELDPIVARLRALTPTPTRASRASASSRWRSSSSAITGACWSCCRSRWRSCS